jgi:hypothetical protein
VKGEGSGAGRVGRGGNDGDWEGDQGKKGNRGHQESNLKPQSEDRSVTNAPEVPERHIQTLHFKTEFQMLLP